MSLRFPSLLPALAPVPRPRLAARFLRSCMRLFTARRAHAVAGLALAGLATPLANAQTPAFAPRTNHVVVPQIGACVIDGGAPRLRVAQVVANVRLFDEVEQGDAASTTSKTTARTTLEVTVVNPTDAHEAFELVVPAPRGANPSGSAGLATAFATPTDGVVTVQDVLLAGGIANAPETTPLTVVQGDAAVDAMLALTKLAHVTRPVEFAGHDLLATEPFEIGPQGQTTVCVEYTEALTWTANETHYTLPRSLAHESIVVPWGLDLLVNAGPDHTLARVFVPTQEVSVQANGPRERRVRFAGGRHAEPGPIHVRVLRTAGPLTGRALFTTEPGAIAVDAAALQSEAPSGGLSILDVLGTPAKDAANPPAGAFLLYTAFDPDLENDPEVLERARDREVLFVFDRSGSMRGAKLTQAREAALNVLEGLGADETFNILSYSSGVEALFQRAQLASEENRQRARDFVYGLDAQGSTNIDLAMSRALAIEPAEGHLPLVLFLTDGLPTAGEKDERRLTDKLGTANQFGHRILAFGVGYDVNTGLLDSVSARAGGSSHYVRPEENVEERIAAVYDAMRTPILTAPRLTAFRQVGDGQVPVALDLQQPARLPDVYAGGSLTILGRCTATEPIVLRLTGDFLGEERHFDFTLDPAEGEPGRHFVPQLWASRTIASLVQDIRKPGRTSFPAKLGELMLALSARYGIIGEYTAFLSLEGTDLWNKAQHKETLRKVMTERAQAIRVGRAAVSQSMNANLGLGQVTLNRLNRYVSGTMHEVTIPTVRQVAGRAFFKRGTTWVDSLLFAPSSAAATQAIDEVVPLGSARYVELVRKLASTGDVALLSLPGGVLFAHAGKCLFVQPQ